MKPAWIPSHLVFAWTLLMALECGWTAEDFEAPVSTAPPARFQTKFNAEVPAGLAFVDEQGKAVRLRSFLGKRPVILNFAYYECPGPCTEVLNGLVQAMKGMDLKLGSDYDILSLSIDAREKPALARAKKRVYCDRSGQGGGCAGWAFLTGQDAAIRPLAEAVGFEYRYRTDIDQFDHALGLVILRPNGRVASYLTGSEFDPNLLRHALVEASR